MKKGLIILTLLSTISIANALSLKENAKQAEDLQRKEEIIFEKNHNETKSLYFVNTELEDSTVFHKKPKYPPSEKQSSDNTLEYITEISQYIDTLLINEKEPIYDRYNEMYIMPVSQKSIREQNFQATIKFHFKKVGAYELRINGIPIESEFKFKDFQEGAIYSLDIYSHDKLIAASPITFTFLPIVEINGTGFNETTYQPGSICVNDPDNTGIDMPIHALYRYRGNLASTKNKKAYAIKLVNENGVSIDRSFFGLRPDNNWILDAMAVDAGRMRNRVSTDLWNAYSTKPYFFNKEPLAINGTRGRFVEVILNGEYAGIYCMTEKLDRKQLRLKKSQGDEISDIIRGVLYKSNAWTYATWMGRSVDDKGLPCYPYTPTVMYDNLSDTWDGWEMQYPDIKDGQMIDWSPLYRAINLVAAENNITKFKSLVNVYFDLPVFLDYYLLIELIFATDNIAKNMFIFNYNIQDNLKMSIAPWDMDGTWGRYWDGSTYIVEDPTLDLKIFGEHALYKRLSDSNYENWNQKLADRYTELRKTYFEEDSLIARFVNYRNLFLQSGTDKREIHRWNGVDILFDFDYEIDYLKSWIHTRLMTLDRTYNYDPTGIITIENPQSDLSVESDYGKIIIHATSICDVIVVSPAGIVIRRMKIKEGTTEINNLMPGIYIVNKKKVLVK